MLTSFVHWSVVYFLRRHTIRSNGAHETQTQTGDDSREITITEEMAPPGGRSTLRASKELL